MRAMLNLNKNLFPTTSTHQSKYDLLNLEMKKVLDSKQFLEKLQAGQSGCIVSLPCCVNIDFRIVS